MDRGDDKLEDLSMGGENELELSLLSSLLSFCYSSDRPSGQHGPVCFSHVSALNIESHLFKSMCKHAIFMVVFINAVLLW